MQTNSQPSGPSPACPFQHAQGLLQMHAGWNHPPKGAYCVHRSSAAHLAAEHSSPGAPVLASHQRRMLRICCRSSSGLLPLLPVCLGSLRCARCGSCEQDRNRCHMPEEKEPPF